jgi:hypothetical protein
MPYLGEGAEPYSEDLPQWRRSQRSIRFVHVGNEHGFILKSEQMDSVASRLTDSETQETESMRKGIVVVRRCERQCFRLCGNGLRHFLDRTE